MTEKTYKKCITLFQLIKISEHPLGVLKFELGTEVRPEVSTTTLKAEPERKIATYIYHLFFEGPPLIGLVYFFHQK